MNLRNKLLNKHTKDKIKQFLEENNFLPISDWNSFEIIHRNVPPKDSQEIDKIKNIVSNKNGLYVYKKDRKTLYIGKGQPLFKRIKDHYRLSYEELACDRSGKWHRFFSTNQGKIRIYWKEEKNEDVRQIIEKMLSYTLNPKFNSFEKSKNT